MGRVGGSSVALQEKRRGQFSLNLRYIMWITYSYKRWIPDISVFRVTMYI